MTDRFTVPGYPIAWQRPQRGVSKYGRSYTYTPNKTLEYQKDVAKAAKVARVRIHEGIVALTLRFFGCKGDIDNYCKSILDALNGIAYNDDRQVHELHVFVDRRGKPPRAEVEIRSIGEAAA